MRVAIIGAGVAGLSALKRCIENKDSPTASNKITDVVCYEKNNEAGGIWVYTDETGIDKYGLPVHSSMYKNLRTNLPKEVMSYPGFKNDIDPNQSYVTRSAILDYLDSYCKQFNLHQYIKFLHNVEMIEPTVDEDKKKWLIKVKDLVNGVEKVEYFDAVMVCNGHYFEPSIPVIKGQEKFQGQQVHSHDYRVPEAYEGKKVVVMGAGRSGIDIAVEIASKASQVFLSHHNVKLINTIFPDNIIQVPDIVEINETEIIFSNGQRENVDVICWCTGYKYAFPFLSDKCGVKVDDNMVTPLWKHMISIENPTLAIIGVPFYVCAFNMCDLQVRFVLKYWLGDKQFPAKDIMISEEADELERKKNEGLSKRHFHRMGLAQSNYYDDLAKVAGVEQLPPVLGKMHADSGKRFLEDLSNYRQDRYQVVDDFNFIKL
ncbi:hypothetical protein HCN44_007999 [Aphidius gifuensis]|uniref:Flavin-containing monooxygenase n=1 Tax=Aphidius gifuensis TaxID=684658 RepID=A0A834XLU1_APHGI|nr:senecionine N-oxygenase-like [Aphidius gifuensis]KAF7989325.1 hypothetical protein HCN44_007999 [Aphidius gifuensis]